MKIKEFDQVDLELLSYADIAYMIIKENKKPMGTTVIFKEVCKLLKLSDCAYADKIGNFYTSLTLDKRFVLLHTIEWDLQEKHSVKVEIDDDEETDDESLEHVDLELSDEEESVVKVDPLDNILDSDELEEEEDDDLEDLTIVTEDEIE